MNILYDDIMYNEATKEEFLSTLDNDGYKDNYRRLFKISYPIENSYKKDLCEFTRDELRGYFYRIMPKTAKASRVNVSHIITYIDWAIERGFRKSNVNPLALTDSRWRDQFAQNLKSYWTDVEIRQIVQSRANNQDAVIIQLLFNGVYGKSGNELTNLTFRNIDKFTNKLRLFDPDNEANQHREITVDEDVINACLKAYEEKEYEAMNGNPDPDAKRKSLELIDNDYVIRLAKTRTTEHGKADHNVLHRRLSKIADEIDEPNFTPKFIVYSGMIAMAKDLYLLNGKLDNEEFEKIMKQFNVDDVKMYRYKHDFLNLETIKELYELA